MLHTHQLFEKKIFRYLEFQLVLPKIEIEILCVKKILNHCEHLLTCDLNEWLTLGITNSGQRRVDYFRSNLEYVHGMGIC